MLIQRQNDVNDNDSSIQFMQSQPDICKPQGIAYIYQVIGACPNVVNLALKVV